MRQGIAEGGGAFFHSSGEQTVSLARRETIHDSFPAARPSFRALALRLSADYNVQRER